MTGDYDDNGKYLWRVHCCANCRHFIRDRLEFPHICCEFPRAAGPRHHDWLDHPDIANPCSEFDRRRTAT